MVDRDRRPSIGHSLLTIRRASLVSFMKSRLFRQNGGIEVGIIAIPSFRHSLLTIRYSPFAIISRHIEGPDRELTARERAPLVAIHREQPHGEMRNIQA